MISETSSVKSKEDQQEEEIINEEAIQTEAAITIQAAFRGMKVNECVSNMIYCSLITESTKKEIKLIDVCSLDYMVSGGI